MWFFGGGRLVDGHGLRDHSKRCDGGEDLHVFDVFIIVKECVRDPPFKHEVSSILAIL